MIGIVGEPPTLNPMFFTGNDVAAFAVSTTIFMADVQWDSAWRPFPQGAEFLPSLRDGTWSVEGERMTLKWKIRPRTWHDGKAVTCADYAFTLRIAKDTGVPLLVNTQIPARRIAGVTCPRGAGGMDITVQWNERNAYANLVLLPFATLPRHVLELFYRSNPGRLREGPYGLDPSLTVGDGAYRLREWRRGESLTVEAVANHAIFGTPKIRRITWRFFPDSSALFASLLSGAIDVASSTGLALDQAVELERQSAGRFTVVFSPGLIWEHADFNLDNPLLQDVRVRRAIAHGINRVQIVQQLFQGKQPVSHSYLPPKHPGYTDNVQRYPYDPARARALLREAGFTPGPDGIMRNAAGQTLSLELSTTAGIRFREQVEQIIQQQLQQVGVDIRIANFPRRIFFPEILARRRFKALAMYAWIWSPTSGCDLYFTSDGIPTETTPAAGGNYPGYRNAEMDQVCKAIERELDETKRNRLLNESARIFARDLPALPLYYRTAVAATKASLQNFAPPGTDTPETWNAHQWYWK